jgi:hypothetical protein
MTNTGHCLHQYGRQGGSHTDAIVIFFCLKKKMNDIPLHAPILVVKAPWIDMLLDGRKNLEVRSGPCKKPLNQRVFLSRSGTGLVEGSVTFRGSVALSNLSDWNAERPNHRVPDDLPFYGSTTFGWRFSNPELMATPVPYRVKRGAIVWRKFEKLARE